MRQSDKIVLASNNIHKLEEFKALKLQHPPLAIVEFVLAKEIIRNSDKLSFVEKHDTYLKNAIAKARVANQACHYPVLADDSGLEVMSLEGKPGVFSHRFATSLNGMTQDQANIEKLLDEMGDVDEGQRQARFVATLVLVMEGLLIHAEGALEGTIGHEPKGKNGFGYDPIFIPKGHHRTLAEMSNSEKNAISHRSIALKHLLIEAQKKGIEFVLP